MRQTPYRLAIILLSVCLLFGCTVPGSPDTPEYVTEAIELDHGIGFCGNAVWDLTKAISSGLPIELNVQHQDFSTDAVTFSLLARITHDPQQLATEWTQEKITASNGIQLYWKLPPETYDSGEAAPRYPHVFIKITIRCEDRVIGYAVVCYDPTAYHTDTQPSIHRYDLHLLEAYLYPKVGGAFQAVSEEYVQLRMDQAIANYNK